MKRQPTSKGWSSYETRCVYRWIGKDQATNDYWHEQARNQMEYAPESRLVRDKNLSIREAARSLLAMQLHLEITTNDPGKSRALLPPSGRRSWRVNWDELAESLLSDLPSGGEPCKIYPIASGGRNGRRLRPG